MASSAIARSHIESKPLAAVAPNCSKAPAVLNVIAAGLNRQGNDHRLVSGMSRGNQFADRCQGPVGSVLEHSRHSSVTVGPQARRELASTRTISKVFRSLKAFYELFALVRRALVLDVRRASIFP